MWSNNKLLFSKKISFDDILNNKFFFSRTCGGCVMPVNCELEPEALEQQIAVAKVKVIN